MQTGAKNSGISQAALKKQEILSSMRSINKNNQLVSSKNTNLESNQVSPVFDVNLIPLTNESKLRT